MKLSANEARVIGCLIEKSVVTPDQYPLTLNALTNACNQKSARNPVMTLQPGTVQKTLRDLQAANLVRADENFKSRAEKYLHRFCNSRYSDYQFDAAELAIVCLLLLRGPQTPGELRARSGRLHEFVDNNEVQHSLDGLMRRDGDPLVAKLPRTPGRKDSEYLQLFSETADHRATTTSPAPENRPADRPSNPKTSPLADQAVDSSLEDRVSRLEKELAELKARVLIDSR